MSIKTEYQSGPRDVSCYAQAYADGTWGGRVCVTAHHGSHSDDQIHEMDAQDPSEEAAVKRARKWAEAKFPPIP
ncbi:hypothetical protein ASG30_09345 [Ramlibacter sp. Leaf400]|nr:hypothetical protein ASG30_09345 [Ramlibacter sp. Leaf400]